MRIRLVGPAMLGSALAMQPWGASVAASPTIYRCLLDGVATYSDRPCGPDIQTYDPQSAPVNTYESAPLPERSPAPAAASPGKRSPAAPKSSDHSKRADNCARIEAVLNDVRTRMRTGYKAKEGERLREREGKLKEQRRAACAGNRN